MTWTLTSENDLPFVAKQFVDSLGGRRNFVFHGQMGAGKTTFIQSVLKAMGIHDPDGSPTYSIVNAYRSAYFGAVNHHDVYRLNSVDEALEIGLEDMFYDGSYNFIEWGEKIAELLPEDTVDVRIAVNDDGMRTITVE